MYSSKGLPGDRSKNIKKKGSLKGALEFTDDRKSAVWEEWVV